VVAGGGRRSSEARLEWEVSEEMDDKLEVEGNWLRMFPVSSLICAGMGVRGRVEVWEGTVERTSVQDYLHIDHILLVEEDKTCSGKKMAAAMHWAVASIFPYSFCILVIQGEKRFFSGYVLLFNKGIIPFRLLKERGFWKQALRKHRAALNSN